MSSSSVPFPPTRPAAVLGNGPSLRGVDFQRELAGFDTFGMNAAYRYWDEVNWYPTYYSCLDTVVGLSHLEEIRRLIDRAEEYGIRGFLLRGNLVVALGEQGRRSYVFDFDALRDAGEIFFTSPWVTTGSHTLAWAAMLGYRDIVLLGVDVNYVEIIAEARQGEGAVLEIATTPAHNPNYFFDSYQRQGDRYNIPNPHSDTDGKVHVKSWGLVQPVLELFDTVVVNANPLSQLEVFPRHPFAGALDALADLRRHKRIARQEPGLVGWYEREEGASLDVMKLLEPFLPETRGVMIDVGACHGAACLPFLHRGWQVFAFEPDALNRQELQKNTREYKSILVDSRAVFNVSAVAQPWHRSVQSSGISSMLAFTPGHVPAGSVTTIRLDEYCAEHTIRRVHLCKIAAEGFEYPVLQGFPFARLRPACVVCDFDDRKSIPLGFTMTDSATLLRQAGYHVFISEWHPRVGYTGPYQWRRMMPYPCETAGPLAWGHILAFSEEPDRELLARAVQRNHECL